MGAQVRKSRDIRASRTTRFNNQKTHTMEATYIILKWANITRPTIYYTGGYITTWSTFKSSAKRMSLEDALLVRDNHPGAVIQKI